MAKMTDEELNKALDQIVDQIVDAILTTIMEVNEHMGKIMLKEYDPAEVEKLQQDFDLKTKQMKKLFREKVKNLTTG